MAFGAWLAQLTVLSVIRSFAGASPSSMIVDGRVGGLAMVLPGFWLAVFVGSLLIGGVAIGIAGEPTLQVGALFGVWVTLIVSVALGGVAGASVSLVFHGDANR